MTTAGKPPYRLRDFLRQAVPPLRMQEARALAEAVLAWPQGAAFLRADAPLSAEEQAALQARLQQACARLDQGAPWAYALGVTPFYGRLYEVGPEVLIPRSDSELLIEEALELLQAEAPRPLRVADFCTGSGCLLITLALEAEALGLPLCPWVGVDQSPEALACARANHAKLAPHLPLFWAQADLLSEVPVPPAPAPPYDLILMNPPYISLDEMADLCPEVAEHEPRLALTDEGDGLAFYRRLLSLPELLATGGRLVIEHGFRQRQKILEISRQKEYTVYKQRQDYGGNDRLLILGPGRKETP